MVLTTQDQIKFLQNALTPAQKKTLGSMCCKKHQSGEGLFDVFKSAGKWLGKTLGPAAKVIGPIALKEFVIPMLKKRAGLGLRVPGSGLKLAGSGIKKKRKRAH
jgi:hypothetical protein